MMKRKHLFLALLALMTSTALHAYDALIDGIYYNLSGNEAEVTYKDNLYGSYSGDVVIPESVTYNDKTFSVTGIGSSAFLYCGGLTSITIPEGVTSIGSGVFYRCSGLTSVTIPNSVTSIGNSAFYDCSGLTSIIIPDGVTSIDVYTFYKCSSLTSITIPEGVTNIDHCAFAGCSGLTSITIPNNVTSIGDSAFSGCSGLTSITIPDGVTSIATGSFQNCSGLTSIVVKSGNTKYDSRDNCNAIIETSTNTLMAGCKNTIIPASVTSIGEWAFFGCHGLTSITIPASVTSIGSDAFGDCRSLTSITIPDGVTSIYRRTFSYCSALTSVTIPDGVTSIGDDAFSYCSGLTSIKIPDSVTSIGNYAFEECYGLTSIIIPEGVTSIGRKAFTYCSRFTAVISKIVEPFTFGSDAFYRIKSTCVLTVPKGTRDAYLAAGWTESVFRGGVFEEEVDVPIGSAGYATFYNAGIDRNIPDGIIAFKATVHNGSVLLIEIEGKIPANTPVVLKGAEGTYGFAYTTGAEAAGENQLMVSDGSIDADGTQYALTKKKGVVGFYKIKAGTSIPAGKVYLQGPAGASIKEFFTLEGDDATAIQTIGNGQQTTDAPIFNLAGQRMNKLQKGINIINNKKILNK